METKTKLVEPKSELGGTKTEMVKPKTELEGQMLRRTFQKLNWSREQKPEVESEEF